MEPNERRKGTIHLVKTEQRQMGIKERERWWNMKRFVSFLFVCSMGSWVSFFFFFSVCVLHSVILWSGSCIAGIGPRSRHP